jgi:hypothetical protein
VKQSEQKQRSHCGLREKEDKQQQQRQSRLKPQSKRLLADGT